MESNGSSNIFVKLGILLVSIVDGKEKTRAYSRTEKKEGREKKPLTRLLVKRKILQADE